MRKSLFLLMIFFLPILSFNSRIQAAGVHDFLVLYSNSVHGEVEPCG